MVTAKRRWNGLLPFGREDVKCDVLAVGFMMNTPFTDSLAVFALFIGWWSSRPPMVDKNRRWQRSGLSRPLRPMLYRWF